MAKIESIVWTAGFKRAFKKRVVGKPYEQQFRERMVLFAEDPFDPRVKTHKLSGNLEGSWAFTVAFDCRVIFKFLSDEEILLVDIGSHDEVY